MPGRAGAGCVITIWINCHSALMTSDITFKEEVDDNVQYDRFYNHNILICLKYFLSEQANGIFPVGVEVELKLF